jgi:putative hydrolase of the HAD superfamily
VPMDAIPKAFARSLERDGEHPLFVLERGEITEREFMARLQRGLEEELGRPVSLHGFGARLMDALDPNDVLFDRYRALHARGIRFALCTNNVREWEPSWRGKLPVDELFEVVVDSAFVGTRKPEPEIYAITLERLGLPGGACAFVDDLEINVAAAEAAGMHGIHFRDTAQAIADLDVVLDGR